MNNALAKNAERGSVQDGQAVEPSTTASQETAPGLAARVGHYSRAVGRWIAAGRPVRDEQEVQQIYETLCQPCKHFDAQKEICNTCGCRVREGGTSLTNKIRMATERCPRGKW